MPSPELSRRGFLSAATAAGLAAYAPAHAANLAEQEDAATPSTQTDATPTAGAPLNILYFQVDNLGYGELGCYGGGILRGVPTERIDAFARERLQLLNNVPEVPCTPSRSALVTGRHAIRSGGSARAYQFNDHAGDDWLREIDGD